VIAGRSRPSGATWLDTPFDGCRGHDLHDRRRDHDDAGDRRGVGWAPSDRSAYIDSTHSAQTDFPYTVPIVISIGEGLICGVDNGSPELCAERALETSVQDGTNLNRKTRHRRLGRGPRSSRTTWTSTSESSCLDASTMRS
jgi:hypothetical protein